MKSFRSVLLVAILISLVCSNVAFAQSGADVYKTKCAMCHGPDGKGGKMGTKDFAAPEVQKESDADLAAVITNGKGKMPKYAEKLKEGEIKDLVTYIRGLAKK